ncbi:hypothetical protein Dimus_010133 [Dionaea muscipula]
MLARSFCCSRHGDGHNLLVAHEARLAAPSSCPQLRLVGRSLRGAGVAAGRGFTSGKSTSRAWARLSAWPDEYLYSSLLLDEWPAEELSAAGSWGTWLST